MITSRFVKALEIFESCESEKHLQSAINFARLAERYANALHGFDLDDKWPLIVEFQEYTQQRLKCGQT